jgi:hypothetical protein
MILIMIYYDGSKMVDVIPEVQDYHYTKNGVKKLF